jgi:hypothetical protein
MDCELPVAAFGNLIRRTISDIRIGRHLESYALFLIGVVLVVLGLLGVAGTRILLSVILLALSFLVFHSSLDSSSRPATLDKVLLTRESFGTFSKLLPGVRDLRIYGPTAVNVLVSSGDIRRFVLDAGGSVRVIVQDPLPELMRQTALQLDDNVDFESTLRSSIATLEKLATNPGFKFRTLHTNPGYSLTIVNASKANGYVIFESHGFKDENIADRMHIVIKRRESEHWFAYWVTRFDAMWETAHEPSGV